MTRWSRPIAAIAMMSLMVPVAATAGDDGDVFGYEAWKTEVVLAGLDPNDVVFPFSASPEMIAWAEKELAARGGSGPDQRLQQLQDAMFSNDDFDFTYDDERTLTAQEAFDARRGNCMSFTALFIALSRGVGIPTFLMSVEKTPDVGRDGNLVVINRHVVAAHREGKSVSTFDFYLTSETPYLSHRKVDDLRASALFHTNLGGKALRDGELDEARWHLEIATTLAPDWGSGWVNLGVTLAHLGDTDGAFEAYRTALGVDPGNSSAFTNMSHLYRRLGREQEARVALQAAAKSTESPFTLIAMADSEVLRGDYREASRYLKQAKRRYPKEPEVFDALARLARREGDDRRAEKYQAKAAKLRKREKSPS